MEKLRIGVIGCGRISVIYAEAFKKLEDMIEVSIAVDKDISRAQKFAKDFQDCEYTNKLEDIFSLGLDVVHILTPHFLHKEQSIKCLQSGIHVLTEKPIAIQVADAEDMIQASLDNQKKLGVIFQNRYNKGIQVLREAIQSKRLGKMKGVYSTLHWWRPPSYYECDWKGKWATEGGGVVIDQAIHSLDLVRYLLDSDVVSVHGHIDQRVLKNIEVEDIAEAIITFENGTNYVFFACNYYFENSPIRIEFDGERGKAVIEGDKVTISIDGETDTVIEPERAEESMGQSYWGNNHLTQMKLFYDAVLNDSQVEVDPVDAIKTLAVVQGIYESSRKNEKVYLN